MERESFFSFRHKGKNEFETDKIRSQFEIVVKRFFCRAFSAYVKVS